MKKRNITLIFIFIVIMALFTTCSVRSCNETNKQETIIIASPTPPPFENLIESVEEPEEVIWIDTVDYTSMTKSKIQNRIDSLTELVEVTDKWSRLTEINKQTKAELEIATNHLNEGNYLNPYTEEDFLLLSYMIHIEAGADITTDEEQCLVGCVIINRRNQGGINKRLENPTIKDIINEAGQYAICRYDKDLGRNTFYVDIDTVDMSNVSDRCKENARKVLEGEFTCPENVVFQALFTQGEIYKSFYHEPPFNNTTYFCYGR